MTAHLDRRPPGLDITFRPGNPLVTDLTWPAGTLVGRTFTAALDGVALDVDVVGDVMTITATEAETAAQAEPGAFVLTETTGGGTDDVIVGTWSPSTRGQSSVAASVTVTADAAAVTVSAVAAAHRLVRPHVSIPEDFLDRWEAIKAEADTRLIRGLAFGDSLGAGFYATDFRDLAYPALIAAALRDELGDGGSGWIDAAQLPFFFLPQFSGEWVETGAWSAVTGGPNFGGRRPTVAGNGATATTTVRGTTIDIVQRRGSGFGQWTYTIDGGAPVAVSAANATPDIHTTTITGLADTTHTVVLTCTTGDCRLFGIRGRSATGFVLDNYSRPSAAYVNTAASLNLLGAADGLSGQTNLSTTVNMHSALDLVILGLGVNDALNTEVTTAGLETVLHTLWDEIRGLGPDGDPPMIVTLLPHLGKHDDADASPEYPRVCSTLRAWSESVGAAVVDVWAEGRRSWPYWNGLGAWGELSPGSPDSIHLSDTGHELTAASAIALLTR